LLGAVERRTARNAAQRERDRTRKQKEDAIAKGEAEARDRTARIERRNVELAEMLIDRPRLRERRGDVEVALRTGGERAANDLVQQLLEASDRPRLFPRSCVVSLEPHRRSILVRYELPGTSMIPKAAGFVFDQRRRETKEMTRKESELQGDFRRVVARTMVRALADVFDVTPPELVGTVGLNGYVADTDPATGRPHAFVLASVNAKRQAFEEVILDDPVLDPVACLLRFDARLSPRPFALQPVLPVVRFDSDRTDQFDLAESTETAPATASRVDLLAMSPRDFELLVKRLFVAMGMRAWATQQSRDGGIDVIAVVEEELTGIECVVEAKRYSRLVPPKEVRSLLGAMVDRNAHKGFVVTTGWFSSESYDFAGRNRLELIDGKRLRHLLRERCGLDVVIPLRKAPPGWSDRDIS